jgi:hypothetical protein
MLGPFPSLEAFCDQTREADNRDRKICPHDAHGYEHKLDGPHGLWRAARVFGSAESRCSLGVKTDRGWFVRTNAFDCMDQHVKIELKGLAVRDIVPGEPAELVLSAEESEVYRHDGPKTVTGINTNLLVCGIGSSNAPSCVQLVSNHRLSEASDYGDRAWSLDLDFKPGEVIVTASGLPPPAASHLVGRHPFAFP